MSDEFHAYQSEPTPDHLIRLLRAHQDRIYRLCLQILRRPHDAEDAAQEVLVRIADGVRGIDDPESFRRWVYRVSLNAALEAARKAARRRVHESRAAMKPPAGDPLDDESRRALFEAIAKLDDRPRSLLLDHYFEGETLESLGSREGVTPQAVSRRLDRAREELKRALPAAFLGVPDLGRLFERGFVAPAVPDLVSGPVLAKVAAIAGGTLMAAKSSVIGVTVAVALMCFVAGAGAGAIFKGRSARGEVAALAERLAAAERRLAHASAPDSVPLATAKVPVSTPERLGATSHKEAASSKLKEKLARYRTWIEAYFKEYDEVGVRDPGGLEAYRARKYAELGELLVGMKDLVCASPAEFLEYVRDTRNEKYLRSLILYGLGFMLNDRHHGQEFKVFPRELHDGMLDLLMAGSLQQKTAMLQYFALIWNQPSEFKSAYPQFLAEPDPWFQVQVVRTIAQSSSWTDEAFAAVTRLGHSTHDSDVRMEIGNAMMWAKSPEAFSYLIDRLEATTDHHEVISVGQTLMTKIMNTYQQKRPPVEMEDRITRAVSAAMGRGFDGATFLVVVRPALELPVEKLKPILQQALSLAPTEQSRRTVAELIQLVAAGNSTAGELRAASWK